MTRLGATPNEESGRRRGSCAHFWAQPAEISSRRLDVFFASFPASSSTPIRHAGFRLSRASVGLERSQVSELEDVINRSFNRATWDRAIEQMKWLRHHDPAKFASLVEIIDHWVLMVEVNLEATGQDVEPSPGA